MSNIFFNEINCKKFRNFLPVIVNFRLLKKHSKFFTAEFIEKNFENFLQSIFLKKKIRHFFGKFEEKKNLPQKKKGR